MHFKKSLMQELPQRTISLPTSELHNQYFKSVWKVQKPLKKPQHKEKDGLLWVSHLLQEELHIDYRSPPPGFSPKLSICHCLNISKKPLSLRCQVYWKFAGNVFVSWSEKTSNVICRALKQHTSKHGSLLTAFSLP